MHLEELRELLMAQPACTEDTPFGPDVIAYRVAGKIFALVPLEPVPARVNLKCDPERAMELRDRWPDGVLPGYHMNKQQWNTVILTEVPPSLTRELIAHSWEQVVAGLTRKARAELLATLD